MPSYTLQGPVPSAEVTRGLLERLEDHILSAARSICGPLFDASAFHVEIVDPLGTQRLASIREHAGAQFLDGTTSLRLSYWQIGSLRINVGFSTARSRSEVTIEVSSDSPREKAIGLQAELIALIATHATRNWIFSPTLPIEYLLWLLTVVAPWVSLIATAKELVAIASTLLAVSVLMWCYWLLKRLLPYTTFDSRQARASAGTAKWLLLGILGFLLFTVAGVFLRKRLLGY